MSIDAQPTARAPERVRAVFSTEDFQLLRVAVAHYLQQSSDDALTRKYGRLYHRLGRVS